MTKGLIYLHGKSGSALEAEHYRPLFPGYDIVGFDYQDKMVGTIELTLIKENDIWKVDKLGVPKFDVISLPQIEADPSEQ